MLCCKAQDKATENHSKDVWVEEVSLNCYSGLIIGMLLVEPPQTEKQCSKQQESRETVTIDIGKNIFNYLDFKKYNPNNITI